MHPSLYFERFNSQQNLTRFYFEILTFGGAEVIQSIVMPKAGIVRPEAQFKHANKHTYIIGYTVNIYCLHMKVRTGKVRLGQPTNICYELTY